MFLLFVFIFKQYLHSIITFQYKLSKTIFAESHHFIKYNTMQFSKICALSLAGMAAAAPIADKRTDKIEKPKVPEIPKIVSCSHSHEGYTPATTKILYHNT